MALLQRVHRPRLAPPGQKSPRPRPEHRARHFCQHRGLPVQRRGEAARARAPADAPRPRARTASPTCSSILMATGSLLSGPIVVASSNGSPSRIRSVTGSRELLDELVADRAMDKQALAGRAALTRAQEAGCQRRLDRGVEVGVVEHDQRPITAHLEQGRLARGGLCDATARRGGADERHPVGAGIAGDLVPDDRPRAGDQVEHSRREIRLGDASGQRHGAHGRRRGGRPDHRVAAGQRRGDQLGGHRVGPVPRTDHPTRPRAGAEPAAPAYPARTSWAALRRAAWRPPPPFASTRSARRPHRMPRPAAAFPGPW